MTKSVTGVRRRLLVASVLFSSALTLIGQSPAPAAVTAVSGSACGYFTSVGLFGGPLGVRGCGQPGVTPGSASYSPSVTLPGSGSATAITGSDPDGAIAEYGPAKLFSGQYPNALNDPTGGATSPPSGPQSVSTQGTVGGSVTSSASISQGTQGTVDPTQPRGIGPGPVIADAISSTCTASESGVTGSTTVTNGVLETKYDPDTQIPIATEAVPTNPPPNYTRSGTIDHVGDRFVVVYNEQVIGPDSITVNAVHMYLLGDTARGEMVIGQSRCAITSTLPNATPVAANDAYSTNEDTALTVAAPGLLANDSDPAGDPLTATNAQAVFVPGPDHPSQSTGNTYSFPSQPANGTVTINPNGSFTYTPAQGFSGTDTFKYVARDPRGANAAATVTVTVGAAVGHVVADFTGDAKTDLSIFRPSNGAWFVQGGTPEVTGYGASGDVPVAGDYDGDGKADIAVFRPSQGAWYVQKSGGGDTALGYGATGDIPVPGDYDGDGKTDIAVFRPSQGVWYISNSAGGDTALGYGANDDVPVPGDYDGDGKTDIAVFRPSQGVWYINNSAGGDTALGYGASGDMPVQGDYDGDGKTDIAVFRPSQGVWYIHNSAGGDTALGYGTNGDIPAPLSPAVRMRFF